MVYVSSHSGVCLSILCLNRTEARRLQRHDADLLGVEGASMAWEDHEHVPTLSCPNSMHVMYCYGIVNNMTPSHVREPSPQ